MTLSKVEHALGMMRIYLVECATQNDWGDHRADELARTIAACLRQTTEEPDQKAAGARPETISGCVATRHPVRQR